MTPIEVMSEQVEPMLTLTTEDDINWMVVSSNPVPNNTISPPKEPDIQKPSGESNNKNIKILGNLTLFSIVAAIILIYLSNHQFKSRQRLFGDGS